MEPTRGKQVNGIKSRRMASSCKRTSGAFKQTASGRAGNVEFWHGNDAVLWIDNSGDLSGKPTEPKRN